MEPKYIFKLEKRKLKDLKPNPKNPRQISKHRVAHLTRMIETYGQIDKPIINLDNTIIAGHQRVKILKKSKVKEVECHVPDKMLTEKDVDDLMLGHNLHTGSWDYDLMSTYYDVPELLEFGFEAPDLQLYDSEPIDETEEKKAKEDKKCPHCGGML